MEALYLNDALRGRGYGRFRITEQLLPLPEGVAYMLQRSSDSKYLGVTGWQDAAEPLYPDEILPDTDGVLFLVSPQVVNQLDEMENYRFFVHVPGKEPLRCRLEVSGVIYADMDSSTSVPEPVIPQAIPRPVPEPSQPEPEVRVEQALPPESLSFGATPPPKKSHVVPLVLLAMLMLALIGSGAYFLYDRSNTPPLPDPALTTSETPPAVKEEPVSPPAPAETPQPSATTPAVLSPMTQARTFLRGNGSAADAVKLGRKLSQSSSEDQDAFFLLMEVAAEGGNAEAMLEVARFYNPGDPAPSGTVIKDPDQAAMWYKKAAATPAAAAGAAQGLATLQGWLQQEVAKGSMNAKALLERLQ